MEQKYECPNGVPEESCDHASFCNVWKLREAAKKGLKKPEEKNNV